MKLEPWPRKAVTYLWRRGFRFMIALTLKLTPDLPSRIRYPNRPVRGRSHSVGIPYVHIGRPSYNRHSVRTLWLNFSWEQHNIYLSPSVARCSNCVVYWGSLSTSPQYTLTFPNHWTHIAPGVYKNIGHRWEIPSAIIYTWCSRMCDPLFPGPHWGIQCGRNKLSVRPTL